MEIAVLGGGMVGSLIATELSKDYNITVIDNEPRNIEGAESKIMDVNSKEFPIEILNYDIAVNCLPGFMGFKMLELSCVWRWAEPWSCSWESSTFAERLLA